MSSKLPLTKREQLAILINEIIDALNPDVCQGLINLDKIDLKRIAGNGKALIQNEPALYYVLLGMIEAYKGNFLESEKCFNNAKRLGGLDSIDQSNYHNVLIKLT